MSEMIERVARAILSSHDWTGDSTGEPDEPCGWGSLTRDWQDAYRAMARAAIEEMRVATETMVVAGLPANTCELPGGGQLVMAVEPAWEAMIDAALA